MSKILYVSPKECIEVSFPDWLKPWMSTICKYIKVKTIDKSGRVGRTIKHTWIDEAVDIRNSMDK